MKKNIKEINITSPVKQINKFKDNPVVAEIITFFKDVKDCDLDRIEGMGDVWHCDIRCTIDTAEHPQFTREVGKQRAYQIKRELEEKLIAKFNIPSMSIQGVKTYGNVLDFSISFIYANTGNLKVTYENKQSSKKRVIKESFTLQYADTTNSSAPTLKLDSEDVQYYLGNKLGFNPDEEIDTNELLKAISQRKSEIQSKYSSLPKSDFKEEDNFLNQLLNFASQAKKDRVEVLGLTTDLGHDDTDLDHFGDDEYLAKRKSQEDADMEAYWKMQNDEDNYQAAKSREREEYRKQNGPIDAYDYVHGESKKSKLKKLKEKLEKLSGKKVIFKEHGELPKELQKNYTETDLEKEMREWSRLKSEIEKHEEAFKLMIEQKLQAEEAVKERIFSIMETLDIKTKQVDDAIAKTKAGGERKIGPTPTDKVTILMSKINAQTKAIVEAEFELRTKLMPFAAHKSISRVKEESIGDTVKIALSKFLNYFKPVYKGVEALSASADELTALTESTRNPR